VLDKTPQKTKNGQRFWGGERLQMAGHHFSHFGVFCPALTKGGVVKPVGMIPVALPPALRTGTSNYSSMAGIRRLYMLEIVDMTFVARCT